MNLNVCYLLIGISFFSISGCGKSRAQKELEAVKEVEIAKIALLKSKTSDAFNDPNAVQFRNTTLNPTKTALCGDVNAKNSFGGYIGFRPFVASESSVVVWNGGCDDTPSTDMRKLNEQIACNQEQNAYLRAAINNGCKTQEEINRTLLVKK